MGGGWETRRKRAPGSTGSWCASARAAASGSIEMDTNHFKGNYPDRCSLEGSTAPGARITDLDRQRSAWQTMLPETKLAPRRSRPSSRPRSRRTAPFTHVRLNIFPDGGVSRLRPVVHARAGAARRPQRAADRRGARARCCAAAARHAGPRGMPDAAPLRLDRGAAEGRGRRVDADWSRPTCSRRSRTIPRSAPTSRRCGERFASTAAWSSAEQSGMADADDETLEALRDGNVALPRARFGYVFLVCATGKTRRRDAGAAAGAPGQRSGRPSCASPPPSRRRSPASPGEARQLP